METNAFFTTNYHKILCPEFPSFLEPYMRLPVLQRLDGVGLLCGTDWTPLFKNKFFYSRLSHSLGVAMIVWNFTHSKTQTLAGLFHDVATPAFSHVNDFRNGDALTQESTEALTSTIINNEMELSTLLFKDGIYKYEIDDYHQYPVADNSVPGLSADRLEYMYPSGAALSGIWTIEQIEDSYNQVTLLKNENGIPELGFADLESAVQYTEKFLEISMILQHNEDKLAMQLLADVLKCALEHGHITERDLYSLDEEYLIFKFDGISKTAQDAEFAKLYNTFRRMESIEHRDSPLENGYNVNLNVKKRWVDPLVKSSGKAERVSALHPQTAACIQDFLAYSDTPYGSVAYTTLSL